jgi:hypothetical protein
VSRARSRPAGERAEREEHRPRRRAAPARSREPTRPAGFLDRALALAADARPELAGERLRALRRFLLTWGAVRSWVWLAFGAPVDQTVLALAATALTAAAALAFTRRFERIAPVVALAALLAELFATLPLTHNHFFVELYAVAILALGGGNPDEDPRTVAGLRWLVALVLLHTGLQKLLYGHYLHGDFLAFMVGRGDRFADLFRWTLPESEVARLASYDPFREGAGPYRVAETSFVVLSNLVWIAEIGLPVALLVRRTRVFAAAAAIAFVVALQLGARELGFALLFGNLLLIFAPPRWATRVLPLSLGVLAVTLAAAWGLLPGREIVQEWHLW